LQSAKLSPQIEKRRESGRSSSTTRPVFPAGADIANGASGEPLYVSGRVLDTVGRPVADAVMNVWQSDDRGLYDVQDNFDPSSMWGRGRIACDPEGRYAFWSVMPTAYPAPMDAALGELINATTKRWWRPAHLHFAIQKPAGDAYFRAGQRLHRRRRRLRRPSRAARRLPRASAGPGAGREADGPAVPHAGL
jgi:protocatechuate 3,4-dioxygenase beta subunit